MKIHTHLLRVIHKWVGLIIGLQFVLWTLSGTVMALLPMEEVAGGARRDPPQVQLPRTDQWSILQQQLGTVPITGLSLRPLLDRQIYEATTPAGTQLFDVATAKRVTIDHALASRIAAGAYAGEGSVKSVSPLRELQLAVRKHELPIWQIDFADEENSTFYVSATTGALLERRNDTWRLWDFFWMLHNMDYMNRTSFNHPMIIIVGFAAVWLVITGLWLLFRTGWKSDFKKRRSGPC